jgi:hypothetical protein
MLSTRESNPPKLYRLACFEEVAGILLSLAENEGIIVAHIGKIHLPLPLDMNESLRSLIGQRISILRTDIKNKTYLFKVLSEEVY